MLSFQHQRTNTLRLLTKWFFILYKIKISVSQTKKEGRRWKNVKGEAVITVCFWSQPKDNWPVMHLKIFYQFLNISLRALLSDSKLYKSNKKLESELFKASCEILFCSVRDKESLQFSSLKLPFVHLLRGSAAVYAFLCFELSKKCLYKVFISWIISDFIVINHNRSFVQKN